MNETYHSCSNRYGSYCKLKKQILENDNECIECLDLSKDEATSFLDSIFEIIDVERYRY